MNGPGGDTWRAATKRLDQLDSRRVGLAALIIAMAAAAALILWLQRGTTFMSDEWAWINYAGLTEVDDTFRPINQHLTVLPLLLSKLVLGIWGTSLLPLKLIEVAGVLACGAAVYAFALPRVGPLLALSPAMVPMFLGTGAAILLQPLIGLQVIYSIAFGVAALVAVDREDRLGDVAATIFACLSLASFSIGLAFLVGLGVAVVLSAQRLRRAYVFVVPAVLYGAWRIWAQQHIGSSTGPELHNIPAIPIYYVDAIATTTTAFFGRAAMLGPGPGTALVLDGFSLEYATAFIVFAAIEVVAIAYVVRKLLSRLPLPRMLWASLATLLALWASQALVLVEGRTPGEPRYIYPGAVAMALVLAAAAGRSRLSRAGVAVVLALTAVGILGNLPRFKEGRDAIAYHAPRNLAYVGLMDLAGPDADPYFYPATHTPRASPAGALSISVQGYRDVSERYGPIGYGPAQIAGLDEEIRRGSDEVLVRMLRLRLAEAEASRGRDCFRAPARPERPLELPRGGAVLRAERSTPIGLRRFADRGSVEVGDLRAGQPALLRIPADSAPQPWILVAEEPVALTVCAARGPA